MLRRVSICISLSVSFSRPITGSNSFFHAASVKFLVYLLRFGYSLSSSFTYVETGIPENDSRHSDLIFSISAPRDFSIVYPPHVLQFRISESRYSVPVRAAPFFLAVSEALLSVSERCGVISSSDKIRGIPLPIVYLRYFAVPSHVILLLSRIAPAIFDFSAVNPYIICSVPTKVCPSSPAILTVCSKTETALPVNSFLLIISVYHLFRINIENYIHYTFRNRRKM